MQLLDTTSFSFLQLLLTHINAHTHTRVPPADGPLGAAAGHPHLHLPPPTAIAATPACLPPACPVRTAAAAAPKQCVPLAQHAAAGGAGSKWDCVVPSYVSMHVRVSRYHIPYAMHVRVPGTMP